MVKIVGFLGNSEDIEAIAKSIVATDEERERVISLIQFLDVGEWLVKVGNTKPFLIRGKGFEIEKHMSDEELEERMRDSWEELERRVDSGVPREREAKENLTPEGLSLLLDVLKYPFMPLTYRYENLGWSRKKGKEVRDGLDQFIESKNIRLGMSIPTFLLLTERGRIYLESKGHKSKFWSEVVSGKISFVHRLLQVIIRKYFDEQGFKTHLEFKASGKKVDVVALGEKRIAIEVSITSTPSFELAHLEYYKTEFDEVRLVVPTPKLDSYKAFFEKAGTGVIVQSIDDFMSVFSEKGA